MMFDIWVPAVSPKIPDKQAHLERKALQPSVRPFRSVPGIDQVAVDLGRIGVKDNQVRQPFLTVFQLYANGFSPSP